MKKDTVTCRFTRNGCGYDPRTGATLPRGTNIIYHPFFWDVDRAWAHKTARDHGANLKIESD